MAVFNDSDKHRMAVRKRAFMWADSKQDKRVK